MPGLPIKSPLCLPTIAEENGVELLEAINLSGLEDFLFHGIQFPIIPGELSRGVLRSYAAPPLSPSCFPGMILRQSGLRRSERCGAIRSYRFTERHRRGSPIFYELLTGSDALRRGEARERDQAALELQKRLRSESSFNRRISISTSAPGRVCLVQYRSIFGVCSAISLHECN